MDDIVLRVIDLPARVRAVTVVDSQGDYNIYVNAGMSEEQRRKAYQHELKHIKNKHFYDPKKAVDDCEREAEK